MQILAKHTLFWSTLLLISCSQNESKLKETAENNAQSAAAMSLGNPGDPHSWKAFEFERLKNPSTGKIPTNIRQKELAFASRLPVKTDRALSWEARGPINKGGRTRAFAIDISNDSVYYAGGVTGGVWRSENMGQSWTKTTDPMQMHSVTSIVQDIRPGKEQTWYCGTGEYYGIVSGTSFTSRYSGDGIFKSTDGGLTWAPLASTQSGTPETNYTNGDMDYVWRIVTDHTDLTNDVVLAAVYNGIFRSTDGGMTWTPVLGLGTSTSTADFTDIIITPTGTFYASLSSDGATKGIFRSDDGINWTNITPNSWPLNYRRITMAYAPSDETQIWFFAETPGTMNNGHSVWKYKYLSGDGSGSNGIWENKENGLPTDNCVGFFNFNFGQVNTQSSYDICVAVHPLDTQLVFIGGTNIYRTTDGFTNSSNSRWIGGYTCDYSDLKNYVYPNHHPDQHGIYFHPADPNKMISINDGGVYECNDFIVPDTLNWIDLNNGYITTQFYTVAMEQGQATSDIVIGGMQDNGTWFTNTTELDSAWVEINRGDGSYCAIPEGRNFYIMSTQNSKLYKKDVDDDGNFTTYTRIDPTGGPNNYNFINSFELDPNNNNRLYLNGRVKIWRQDSLDEIPYLDDYYNTISMGWTAISQSQISISAGYITTVESCKSAPNTIWYGTSKSLLYRLDSADSQNPVKTDISGDNWPSNAYISSIAVNPFDSSKIMVTFSNYGIPSAFYTNNGGITWSDVSGNLEENLDGTGSGPAFYWSYIYPNGDFYVGTSTGLYSTSTLDSSNTVWSQEGASTIGNVVINMIDARMHDGKMIVATHGNGVYSATNVPQVESLEEFKSFNVSVYPNPSSDYVQVAVEEDFTYDLYNISGKRILSGKASKKEQLDLSMLPAGTYIMSIQVGEKRKVVKLIKR